MTVEVNSERKGVEISWDPTGGGKTSIRAGFGVFYNPIEQLVLEQLGAQPPFGGSTLVSEGLFQTPFALQGGGAVPNPTRWRSGGRGSPPTPNARRSTQRPSCCC